MKTTAIIILFTIILGAFSWLAEGVADYYTYHQGRGAFFDALIFISLQELYTRLTALVIFVIFGIVIAVAIARSKRMEAALRESQLRLSKSQEIAHLGSWDMDLLTNHLIWSDEVYRIFGLQPQEFTATYEGFLDAVHPDDRARIGAAYFGSIREGKDNYEIEHRVVRKHTGEIRYVYEKCEHIRDASGRVIRSLGMVQDITERKQAEEALRLTQFSVDHAYEAAYWIDSEARLNYVNEAACQSLGYSCEELLGMTVFDIDPVITREQWDEIWLELERQGSGYLESVHRTKQGEVFPVEIATNFLEYGGKKYDFAFVRNITERKQAEKAILDRQARLDSIFRAVPVGVGVVVNRVLTEINERVCEMTGYTKEELIGKCSKMLYPTQEEYDVVGCIKYEQIETPGAGTIETRMQRKDGSIFDVLISSTSIAHDDLSQGVTFTMLDITERKRSEEEKRQFYRETVKSITQGKLNLISCDEVNEYLNAAELMLTVAFPSDTSGVRHEVKEFCTSKGLRGEKLELFETAVGEAITNAIKHAQGGRIYAGTLNGSVWVAVSDDGPGISTLTLPSATLRMGYSTKASMGMGYSIMMEASDRIMLCTGPQGTTVILSISVAAVEYDLALEDLPDTWTNLNL